MGLRVMVKIGKSYYVSIPKSYVEKYSWYDSLLDVVVGENEIVIRKVPGAKIVRTGVRHLKEMKVVGGNDAQS